jgi:curved DNA-binding protein
MPVQYKDYYATLGVAKTASQDEIRKAFRKLARQYHPDVAKDKKNAEAKFKEINEAYEVVSDPEKRKRYDELGADWEHGPQRPHPGWGRGGGGGGFGGFENGGGFSGTGFSDFFEQFFGGAAGRGGGAQGFGGHQQHAARGSDIEADLLVTIEEALHGAKKKISFRRDGKSDVETYEVRIPKGVREGQKIRLAGQGEAGRRGQAGDLYLIVRFEKHPDYTIDGSDLIYDLELPVWQAVLGDNLSVPTPDGPVRLKIPDCSQSGKKFRIKGRGLPTGAATRGDFYVRLVVQLPTDLTPEQRALWEKLSRT